MIKSILRILVVGVLTWQAKLVLKKYKPRIVAVTGSVGKTSTKDAIFSVLSHFFPVRKSTKSYNSEIGVPLTILGVPNAWSNPLLWLQNFLEGFALIVLPNHYPEWLVLEIGADRPGDIESITKWIKPDIAVVTRLSKVPVHVEYFHSVQELVREKSFLVLNTQREGTVILNADDEDVVNFGELVPNNKIFYGTGGKAEVVGSNPAVSYDEAGFPSGMGFDVDVGGEKEKLFVNGALGVQQMYSSLAAVSVGKALSLSMRKMAKALGSHSPASGRMRIIKGVKDTIIIDDTYNSSPVAMEEALNTLDSIKAKRKIVVAGDMLELGIHSGEAHKKAGEHAAKVANLLAAVGVRARFFAEGALNAGMSEKKIVQFDSSREAGKHVEGILKKGDVVLVKGSQGVRMERVVEEIMAEPQKKEKLLVRQEKEWQGR